jgi:hypothetical protein
MAAEVHLSAKSSQVPVTPPWHDKHLGYRLPGTLTVDTDDLGPAPSEVQLKHIFCLSSPLFSPAVLIFLCSFRPN